MTQDLLTQLAEYGTYCNERQGTVSADDVTDAVMPLPMPTQPPRPRNGWLIAAAAAALVLVLVGGLGLLAQRNDPPDDAPVVDQVETETPPVIDPPATTLPPVVEPVAPEEPTADPDTETNTQDLLRDLSPGTESGTLVTPIGRAEWVHLTGDGTTLPFYGDVVEWPSGFAIFQPNTPNGDRSNTRLWVSPNGIEWHIEPLPIPSDVWDASLTLVDDVYWLVSSGPASLWRSADGLDWEEYDLSEVMPGAVGLNWEMDHTPPVTAGDMTLVYASFSSNFPYAEYAPNLTADGRTCDHVRLANLGRDVFQVVEDFGEGPDCPVQPVLRMIEADTGLQVVDNNTEEELGEILGATLNDLAHVTEETMVDRLLIVSDGDVTSVEVPWRPTGIVTLFSSGEAVYAYVDDAANVWQTDDGRTWTELGPLSLVEATELTGYTRFTATSDDRLVAWNADLPNAAWETTDGMNWRTVDLPPLPEGVPVLLDSGWFANANQLGSFDDGDRWWLKAGDTWVTLTDLGIAGQRPVFATGIDTTTFFFRNSGRDLWVLRLDQSG
jgi:hypothetical protein